MADQRRPGTAMFAQNTKTEWQPLHMRELALYILANLVPGKVALMWESSLGKLVFEDMEPFEEYVPVAHTEARVHAITIGDCLGLHTDTRMTMFEYNGEETYRTVFTAASVQRVIDSPELEELRTAVASLECEELPQPA